MHRSGFELDVRLNSAADNTRFPARVRRFVRGPHLWRKIRCLHAEIHTRPRGRAQPWSASRTATFNVSQLMCCAKREARPIHLSQQAYAKYNLERSPCDRCWPLTEETILILSL